MGIRLVTVKRIAADTPVSIWWMPDTAAEAEQWTQELNQKGELNIRLETLTDCPRQDGEPTRNLMIDTTVGRALTVIGCHPSEVSEYFEEVENAYDQVLTIDVELARKSMSGS